MRSEIDGGINLKDESLSNTSSKMNALGDIGKLEMPAHSVIEILSAVCGQEDVLENLMTTTACMATVLN